MPMVVLQLPNVKRKQGNRPKKCPYCLGETFQRWGKRRKALRRRSFPQRSLYVEVETGTCLHDTNAKWRMNAELNGGRVALVARSEIDQPGRLVPLAGEPGMLRFFHQLNRSLCFPAEGEYHPSMGPVGLVWGL
ncbi:hypothetical protein [Anaerolinea thermophila]|uniref:hypothetical protein n=1 Tax=Anaerolinea thermophila TaxID=167964 RepID=UPI00059E18FE|nr:hypothetical protein [Anaerolinea thermophila]